MDKQYLLICQQGELEIKSLLLTLSLLQHKEPNDSIVVSVPSNRAGNFLPSPQTIRFLEKAGVGLISFHNPYLDTEPLPLYVMLSNKFFALRALPPGPEYTIFLDSDVLCLKTPEFPDGYASLDFAAKPADRAGIPVQEAYRKLIGSIPAYAMETTLDNKWVPPYFNSGVMWIRSEIIRDMTSTAQSFFDRLLENKILGEQAFFAEQLAFAMSVEAENYVFSLMDNKYNFPARSRTIPSAETCVFAHYHDVETLMTRPLLREKLMRYMNDYPLVREKILLNASWKKLFRTNRYGRVTSSIDGKLRAVRSVLKRIMR